MLSLTYLNSEIYCGKEFRHICIAEQSNKDVENFIPEFSVTGVLWSAASVICDGNFRCFLPQCNGSLGLYVFGLAPCLSYIRPGSLPWSYSTWLLALLIIFCLALIGCILPGFSFHRLYSTWLIVRVLPGSLPHWLYSTWLSMVVFCLDSRLIGYIPPGSNWFCILPSSSFVSGYIQLALFGYIRPGSLPHWLHSAWLSFFIFCLALPHFLYGICLAPELAVYIIYAWFLTSLVLFCLAVIGYISA